ncbi:MAG: TIGR04282 family arsenosugar biosynthesis glycosyltransferase [Desulfobacterales bacterium]|jgi:rSAM/selenodomain-associated transferase 1|nr:TIGR04282 family arsenosugar biosynthesis glycosyltransferase [Desulfobacterales bacterium]
MSPFEAVLVFLRAPTLGKVKTRLAKHLGDPLALRLYRRFVTDTLETVNTLKLPVRICFDPPGEESVLKAWLGETYEYWPQSNGHLGQKMAAAFERAFDAGMKRVLLIGTDIPDLPGRFLLEALNALSSRAAVIGPAEDGGYYLIGFCATGYLPAIFEALPWGSGEVLAKTLAIFQNHHRTVHMLPTWRDIDDDEDLIAFLKRNHVNKTPDTLGA